MGRFCLHFSSLQSYHQSFEEASGGQDRESSYDNPFVANPSLVSQTYDNAYSHCANPQSTKELLTLLSNPEDVHPLFPILKLMAYLLPGNNLEPKVCLEV